jgi:hypothetical protein
MLSLAVLLLSLFFSLSPLSLSGAEPLVNLFSLSLLSVCLSVLSECGGYQHFSAFSTGFVSVLLRHYAPLRCCTTTHYTALRCCTTKHCTLHCCTTPLRTTHGTLCCTTTLHSPPLLMRLPCSWKAVTTTTSTPISSAGLCYRAAHLLRISLVR